MRILAIGVISALPAIVLPFLCPHVSLSHYIAYLQNASREGLERQLFIANLQFAGVLLAPPALLYWRHLRGDPQPDLAMGWAFFGSLLVVCIIGSISGAGPHHLLPFLPVFAFFLARLAQTTRGPSQVHSVRLAAFFIAIALSYAPRFATGQMDINSWLSKEDEAVLHELRQLYAYYPNAVMGFANDASYPQTNYRVVGLFNGAPIGIEPPAWMDLQAGGVSEELLERLLTDCRTPLWIIPTGGAPFTLGNDRRPSLFSDRFRNLFMEQYRPIREGAFYSVWACFEVANTFD